MRVSRTQTLRRARRVIWEGGGEGGDLGDGGDRREGESQGAWCDGRVLEAAISGAEERIGNSSEGGVHLATSCPQRSGRVGLRRAAPLRECRGDRSAERGGGDLSGQRVRM